MFIESMCPRLLNQRNGAVVFALPLLYIIRHDSSCVVCTFSFHLFNFFIRTNKMLQSLMCSPFFEKNEAHVRSYVLSSLGEKSLI